jgi:hypothetical protein
MQMHPVVVVVVAVDAAVVASSCWHIEDGSSAAAACYSSKPANPYTAILPHQRLLLLLASWLH